MSSARAGEYDEPILQTELSPTDYGNSVNDRYPERTSKRFSKELNTTERRTERRNVVTKEKVVRRRSPVKESSHAGNRGSIDWQAKDVVSPTLRRKQKEAEEREQTKLFKKRNADKYSNKSMGTTGYLDTSFFSSFGM
jgi:hypothetical protein